VEDPRSQARHFHHQLLAGCPQRANPTRRWHRYRGQHVGGQCGSVEQGSLICLPRVAATTSISFTISGLVADVKSLFLELGCSGARISVIPISLE
jgi:hypothetical protein